MNILPGLRDLRVPLATGYLWVLVVWVAVDGEAALDSDSDFMNRLHALSELVGPTASLAAVSFSAYLIGSALSQITVGLFNWQDRGARALRRQGHDSEIRISLFAEETTRRLVRHYRGIRSLLNTAAMPSEMLSRLTSYEVFKESDQSAQTSFEHILRSTLQRELRGVLETRLMIERESIWQNYDRLLSESDLRLSVTPPLFAFVLLASVNVSPWLLALSLLPMALLVQGARQKTQARQTLEQSLVTGLIQSPTVEVLLKEPVSV